MPQRNRCRCEEIRKKMFLLHTDTDIRLYPYPIQYYLLSKFYPRLFFLCRVALSSLSALSLIFLSQLPLSSDSQPLNYTQHIAPLTADSIKCQNATPKSKRTPTSESQKPQLKELTQTKSYSESRIYLPASTIPLW
jgi:hypothetical protein